MWTIYQVIEGKADEFIRSYGEKSAAQRDYQLLRKQFPTAQFRIHENLNEQRPDWVDKDAGKYQIYGGNKYWYREARLPEKIAAVLVSEHGYSVSKAQQKVKKDMPYIRKAYNASGLDNSDYLVNKIATTLTKFRT